MTIATDFLTTAIPSSLLAADDAVQPNSYNQGYAMAKRLGVGEVIYYFLNVGDMIALHEHDTTANHYSLFIAGTFTVVDGANTLTITAPAYYAFTPNQEHSITAQTAGAALSNRIFSGNSFASLSSALTQFSEQVTTAQTTIQNTIADLSQVAGAN